MDTHPSPKSNISDLGAPSPGAVPDGDALNGPKVVEPSQVSTPDVSGPAVSQPETFAPESFEPDVVAPDPSKPEVFTPDGSEPDIVSKPDVVLKPGVVSEPDVFTPGVSEPNVVSKPDEYTIDVTPPAVSEPDIAGPQIAPSKAPPPTKQSKSKPAPIDTGDSKSSKSKSGKMSFPKVVYQEPPIFEGMEQLRLDLIKNLAKTVSDVAESAKRKLTGGNQKSAPEQNKEQRTSNPDQFIQLPLLPVEQLAAAKLSSLQGSKRTEATSSPKANSEGTAIGDATEFDASVQEAESFSPDRGDTGDASATDDDFALPVHAEQLIQHAAGGEVAASDGIGILVELAQKGEIDPKNVDIIDVTDKFLKLIAAAPKENLRQSGKILFHACVLLRMKAEALLNAGSEESAGGDDFMDFDENGEGIFDSDQYVRQITLKDLEKAIVRRSQRRQVRKRQVTLEELIDALREAERIEKTRAERKPARAVIELSGQHEVDGVDDLLDLAHDEDVETTIEKVEILLAKILKLGEKIELMRMVMLMEDHSDWVDAFLASLFLSNAGKIDLYQDEFYGPLYIGLGGSSAVSDTVVT